MQLWHFKVTVNVFFPASTQSPEISSFGTIFAISEQPHPLGYLDTPTVFLNENQYIS